jgi:hypothetical protein
MLENQVRRSEAGPGWHPMAGFGIGSTASSHSTKWVKHHLPTNFIPADSSWSTYFGFTSYRCLCLSSILSLFPYNCSEIENKKDFNLQTQSSFTLRLFNSQRQDIKTKLSKQIHKTLITKLHGRRHTEKCRCCWEHIKTLCYKGRHRAWLIRHMQTLTGV